MERLRPGDPEQIGPWQIVNRLGSGGMGIVYMGTNGTRAAAIKIVRDFLLEDPTSRTRLGREVATLKKVKSGYVAEIVGADVNASPAWIATNYVDGPSLSTLIENEGPFSEFQWFELATGLMSGLAGVHAVEVIHRDIKPSNILMSATGPRVIDFGISFSSDATALTRTGMVAGTPTWFAPEQFQGTKITSAVDNFAAGSTLYFAATGSSPWGKEDTSVANTMNQILTKEPDLSLLTPNQRTIISQLLDKNPKNRITANDCVGLIEGIKNSTQLGGEPPKFGKSKRKLTFALVAGLILISVGLGFTLFSSEGETPSMETICSTSYEESF
jgi:serine/threonine protein kinase